jgi:hypothetical protein
MKRSITRNLDFNHYSSDPATAQADTLLSRRNRRHNNLPLSAASECDIEHIHGRIGRNPEAFLRLSHDRIVGRSALIRESPSAASLLWCSIVQC